jgi:hypothetical protein
MGFRVYASLGISLSAQEEMLARINLGFSGFGVRVCSSLGISLRALEGMLVRNNVGFKSLGF